MSSLGLVQYTCPEWAKELKHVPKYKVKVPFCILILIFSLYVQEAMMPIPWLCTLTEEEEEEVHGC